MFLESGGSGLRKELGLRAVTVLSRHGLVVVRICCVWAF